MLNVNNLVAKPSIGRSEYGRVKVALPRGKGLMDWVRLSTSKILAKRKLPSVNHEELAKHNTLEDCWVHLFGQVYDVTSYLEFHPGGIPELMRAAGCDATPLFNQYHAWVNYESMLKSCLVGRFSGDLTKLPLCGPPTVDETINTAKLSSDSFIQPQPRSSISGIDIEIQMDSLILSALEWTNLSANNVVYNYDKHDGFIRILLRHYNLPSYEVVYEEVRKNLFDVPIRLSVKNNTVQLKFDNLSGILSDYLDNSKRSIRKRPAVKYYECTISEIRRISHDTLLFHVKTPEGVYLPIPLGHHVSLKLRKGLVAFYRPYTPVSFTLPSDVEEGSLTFVIKIYENGSFTQQIKTLSQGDKMEVSDPIGDKNIPEWICDSDLIMLAAGTGITPMIPIIENRLELSELRTELFFFNKTENDIIEDGWALFKWSDQRLKVHHVLSASSATWKGLAGRISADHLPNIGDRTKILVCGPDGFINTAIKLLEAKDVPPSRIHVFKG